MNIGTAYLYFFTLKCYGTSTFWNPRSKKKTTYVFKILTKINSTPRAEDIVQI